MAAGARGAHRHLSTAGAATAAPAAARGPATEASQDIRDRLLAIPGMSLVEEKPYTGYRFFVLELHPAGRPPAPVQGTFQQRVTVLHKDTSRPTVFYTGGYNVSTTPSRREPTQIVDGNQVSMEYRYFTPSRPAPGRLVQARHLAGGQRPAPHLQGAASRSTARSGSTTGGSKGGMTATYYERFYPRDMDGVVAYVAPNDVVQQRGLGVRPLLQDGRHRRSAATG